MNGVIKRIMEKGFGFIAPEGEDKDVFFHASAVQDVEFADLKEGDNVTFDMEESPRGPQAVNVRLA